MKYRYTTPAPTNVLMAVLLIGLGGLIALAGVLDIAAVAWLLLNLVAAALGYKVHFRYFGALGLGGVFMVPFGLLFVWAGLKISTRALYWADYWTEEDSLHCRQGYRLPLERVPFARIQQPPAGWSLKRADLERFELKSQVVSSHTNRGEAEATYYSILVVMKDGRELPVLWAPSTDKNTARQLSKLLQDWLAG